jgi:TetR/AcrR family transcriptional repressor of mexJK operon
MRRMTKSIPKRGRPKDPDKREAILEAAKHLFVEQGYGGASMDAIAAAAGVSKLTLYSHFGRKDQLFQQCVVAKCEEHAPPALYDPANTAPLRQRLLGIGNAFVALVMSEEAIKFYRMMAAEAQQTGKLGRLFHDAGPQRTLNHFEDLLAAAEHAGELQIPRRRLAAHHFFSMLQGEHHMRVIMGERRPPAKELRAHVEDVVEVFLRAYKPR